MDLFVLKKSAMEHEKRSFSWLLESASSDLPSGWAQPQQKECCGHRGSNDCHDSAGLGLNITGWHSKFRRCTATLFNN